MNPLCLSFNTVTLDVEGDLPLSCWAANINFCHCFSSGLMLSLSHSLSFTFLSSFLNQLIFCNASSRVFLFHRFHLLFKRFQNSFELSMIHSPNKCIKCSLYTLVGDIGDTSQLVNNLALKLSRGDSFVGRSEDGQTRGDLFWRYSTLNN